MKFNLMFYKSFDFWISLVLLLSCLGIYRNSLFSVDWWLDAVGLVLGVIGLFTTFFKKDKHDEK
ncbi:MAG TPA: hypothetical protein DCW31_04850 [Lactobacillus sp.]|nr:hypothetical protein [Lactobacillus sp.]